MTVQELIALFGECLSLIGILIAGIVSISKVVNGQKCLLRSEMLRIYYHHTDTKTLRQYEFENFMMLYDAYKRLHGNSFIDKVCSEIKTWEVVS